VAFNIEYNGRDSSTIITVLTETRPLLSSPIPKAMSKKVQHIHTVHNIHTWTLQCN